MPSPVIIKKRIEGLIEREYLARTPEDRYVKHDIIHCHQHLQKYKLMIYMYCDLQKGVYIRCLMLNSILDVYKHVSNL